jgi:hypothetical protein
MATLKVLDQKLQYAGGIEEMLAAWGDGERRQEPQAANRQEHGARLEPHPRLTWAVPGPCIDQKARKTTTLTLFGKSANLAPPSSL